MDFIVKAVPRLDEGPAREHCTVNSMIQVQGTDRVTTERYWIADLPVRYCHCVWKNDIEGIVNLFTQDGAISVPNDPSLPGAQGRDNLLKMYKQALGDLAPRPFIHNHVVELKGPDRATGTCYVEIRAAREGKSWIGAGYYDDEYAKVNGEWKFRSRKVTMYYLVPLSEGWAERAAKRG